MKNRVERHLVETFILQSIIDFFICLLFTHDNKHAYAYMKAVYRQTDIEKHEYDNYNIIY